MQAGRHTAIDPAGGRFLNGGLAPSACKPSAGQAAACIADVSIDVIASLSTIRTFAAFCTAHRPAPGLQQQQWLYPPAELHSLVPKIEARGKKLNHRAARLK